MIRENVADRGYPDRLAFPPLVRRIRTFANTICHLLTFLFRFHIMQKMPSAERFSIDDSDSPSGSNKSPFTDSEPSGVHPPSTDEVEAAKQYLREISGKAAEFFAVVETEEFHRALMTVIGSLSDDRREAIVQQAHAENEQITQLLEAGKSFWEAVAAYDPDAVKKLLED